MTVIYGIDLGTTFSCIARVDETGQPVLLPNAEGQRTTPSVVWFDGNSVRVGRSARQQGRSSPHAVVEMVKRSIGDPAWLFQAGPRTYRAEEISAFILRKVVGDAERCVGPIRDAVITCPAYFGTAEREATARAGQIAGLNVRSLLNEPTAAALAYGTARGGRQVVLVFDLGGGTFDITLIDVDGPRINVLCTGGDEQLGGRDWDNRLVLHLAELARAHGMSDLLDNPAELSALTMQAEAAKTALTDHERVGVRVGLARPVEVELTRATFEALTADLMARAMELTRGLVLMEAAPLGVTRIDRVLLVGGATRMPQVKRTLEHELQEVRAPVELYDPDEVVAKGAALYARQLAGGGNVRMKNVASKTFGVLTLWEGRQVVTTLVRRNDPVPATGERAFVTVHAGQAEVLVRLMEGLGRESRLDPSTCVEVGRARLPLPPGTPAGASIRVWFALDEQGRLQVRAREGRSGREVRVEVSSGGLSSAAALQQAAQAGGRIRVS